MSSAIAKGNFVQMEAHPEYGTGRVLDVGAFTTRVLFPVGGLRVFRQDDTERLRGSTAPSAADLAILVQKEADLARGINHRLPPKPDAVPAKKAARKTKRA